MSGFYLISKIKHSINSSGFSTSLSVVKWPVSASEIGGSN
jgi:hypothetical protein